MTTDTRRRAETRWDPTMKGDVLFVKPEPEQVWWANDGNIAVIEQGKEFFPVHLAEVTPRRYELSASYPFASFDSCVQAAVAAWDHRWA